MSGSRALQALQTVVDQVKGEVLVLHDEVTSAVAGGLVADGLVTCPVGAPIADAHRWSAVVVAVADVGALRRLVSTLPRLGRARTVACLLNDALRPVAIVPRPEWPPVVSLNARRLATGESLTVVRSSRPVGANLVLEEMARAGSPVSSGNRGVFVATTALDPSGAPAADPGLLVLAAVPDGADPALEIPPDVILDREGAAALPAHPVTGRSATVVTDPLLVEGPLDEGVLNPAGFLQRPEQGLVTAAAGADAPLRLRAEDNDLDLRLDRGVTAHTVAALRQHTGVAFGLVASPGLVRSVASLAMAGVPVTAQGVDPGAVQRLGPGLAAALTAGVDLTDPLRREEHSVRLRRAALLGHSTLAWQARLAGCAGIPHRSFPSCSIVLATMREEQLDFALRQVGRQRGPDLELELVVVSHGFDADPARVAELAGCPTTVIPMAAEASFGEVLNAGLAAASGDLVLKMDDDDWYGPDHVSDLLLARHYSGADVVGMTAEFVYLHELDLTLRRSDDSERPARFVAGGTIMIGRSWLNELGGFRQARRYEDASLMASVHAAGGSVYRTHGLGYVLRRRPSGHTWQAGSDYFLDPGRVSDRWAGFTPSRLLEADDVDVPAAEVAPA